ncbi:hypothetical protein LCGC14_2908400, partial [marine sediment metagenome]
MLETYVGPCPEGMVARHLDGNPANNCVSNIVWGTQAENYQDAVKHKTNTCGERHGRAKLKDADIKVIRYLRNAAKFTLVDIAWHFDVTIQTI